MALTKTQTALICAAMVAAPLAFQWQTEARLSQEQQSADARLADAQRQVDQLRADIDNARQTDLQAHAETLAAQSKYQSLTNRINGRVPLPAYQWNDNSPLARVPKQFLQGLSIYPSKDNRGELSEPVKEVLQLTEAETRQIQDALDRFLKECRAAQKMHPITPSQVESNGRPPEEIRAFALSPVGEGYGAMTQALFTQLTSILGSERFDLFKNALGHLVPLEDSNSGVGSAMAFFNLEHQQAFYKPRPGDHFLGWGVITKNSRMITGLRLEEIPDDMRPQLQDWISLMQTPVEGGQP